jgi:hypothetical protein
MDEAPAAPPPDADAFFSRVAGAGGDAAFFALRLARCPRDPEDLSQATLDVTATDGMMAWEAAGIDEVALGAVVPDRLRHLLEALGALPARNAYDVAFTRLPDGGLEVVARWSERPHGKDVAPRVRLALPPAADAGAAVRAAAGAMLRGAAGAAARAAAADAVITALEAAAAADHARLAAHAAREAERAPGDAVKVAALLVSKDERASELERELARMDAADAAK